MNDNPWDECLAVGESIKRKADANKLKARALTLLLTVSTAAIPVLIGLSGDAFVLGKVVPSVLAATTATLVALGQVERPHERWTLYRRYQRLVEAESKLFRYSVSPYDDADRERTLGARIAQLELDLQAEWEGLIPRSDELAAVTKKGSQA